MTISDKDGDDITADEAAGYLGVSRAVIERLLQDGDLILGPRDSFRTQISDSRFGPIARVFGTTRLTIDMGPRPTLTEIVNVLADVDLLLNAFEVEGHKTSDVGPGLRVESLNFENPLEIVIGGTLAAFVGALTAARDWRANSAKAVAESNRIQAEASKLEAEAANLHAQARKAESEARRMDADVELRDFILRTVVADSRTGISEEQVQEILQIDGVMDAVGRLSSYNISIRSEAAYVEASEAMEDEDEKDQGIQLDDHP